MHSRALMRIFTNSIAVVIMMSACTDRAAFQPAEPVSATSPSGQPAAAYDIRAEPGADPRIHVTVWSEGAVRESDRTHIDLAVGIRNTGDQPVTLDRNALALEAFNSAGAPLPAGQLTSVAAEDGTLAVPPASAQTIRLRYDLPVPVSPDQISSLRLRWGLTQPTGERYVQFTEFTRKPETSASAAYVFYDPLFGLYDPFFYPPPFVVHHERVVPVQVVVVPRGNRRAAR